MNCIKLSWNKYQKMIDDLAEQIKESGTKFDGIYGVPRGGLPIVVSLSHKLNLPLLLYPTKNSLICDDISDYGYTLNSFKDRFIATLYTTKWTITKPHCWVEEKLRKTDWIVFPWEEK